MKVIFKQYREDRPWFGEAVANVSTWSLQSDNMLPLSKERIQNFPLSIFGAVDSNRMPLSHAAITSLEDGVAMIGGYVTKPYHRNNGIGTLTLNHLLNTALEQLDPIDKFKTFVNKNAIGQFVTLVPELKVTHRDPPAATGCNFVVEFEPILNKNLQGVTDEINFMAG